MSLEPLYPGMPLLGFAMKSDRWCLGEISGSLRITPSGKSSGLQSENSSLQNPFFFFHGSLLEPFQLLESGWADVFKASQIHLRVASFDQFLGDISLKTDLGCHLALIIQILEAEFDFRSLRQQAGEDVAKAIVALAVGTDGRRDAGDLHFHFSDVFVFDDKRVAADDSFDGEFFHIY
jgi:hypothetical protein